jgi:hypothetical protein
MKSIQLWLDETQLNAAIFAVKSDLETVRNDMQEFGNEEETLSSLLAILERAKEKAKML